MLLQHHLRFLFISNEDCLRPLNFKTYTRFSFEVKNAGKLADIILKLKKMQHRTVKHFKPKNMKQIYSYKNNHIFYVETRSERKILVQFNSYFDEEK